MRIPFQHRHRIITCSTPYSTTITTLRPTVCINCIPTIITTTTITTTTTVGPRAAAQKTTATVQATARSVSPLRHATNTAARTTRAAAGRRRRLRRPKPRRPRPPLLPSTTRPPTQSYGPVWK